jgi:hypothetical protein
MPRLKVIEEEGPWNQSDTALMRVFLHDSLGKKVMRILSSRLPRVTGITMEEAAMNGKLHEGFQLCIDELAKLGNEPFVSQDATLPIWDHSKQE